MRTLIVCATLLRYLGIDRLLYSLVSTYAATCVARGNVARAIDLLERLERLLYLGRSANLALTQYRLASLYEKSSRLQEATILYEGLLRRRIPIAMSGNIRTRLADIRQGTVTLRPKRSERLGIGGGNRGFRTPR